MPVSSVVTPSGGVDASAVKLLTGSNAPIYRNIFILINLNNPYNIFTRFPSLIKICSL